MPRSRDARSLSNMRAATRRASASASAGPRGGWNVNAGTVEEFSVDTSGSTAEAEVSGVRVNIVPKQGGNIFSGFFLGNYANDALQSNNVDADLRSRGVSGATGNKRIYDVNPAFGGPLKRDKVWFFSSYRFWGATELPPGAFYDTNPTDFVFTPDLNRPAEAPYRSQSTSLRLTWQSSQRSTVSWRALRFFAPWRETLIFTVEIHAA